MVPVSSCQEEVCSITHSLTWHLLRADCMQGFAVDQAVAKALPWEDSGISHRPPCTLQYGAHYLQAPVMVQIHRCSELKIH